MIMHVYVYTTLPSSNSHLFLATFPKSQGAESSPPAPLDSCRRAPESLRRPRLRPSRPSPGLGKSLEKGDFSGCTWDIRGIPWEFCRFVEKSCGFSQAKCLYLVEASRIGV